MASKLLFCSLIFTFSLYVAFSQEAQTLPPLSKAVVILTDENFNNHVTNTSSWVVMYYAPWCPHCKHSMPAFDQFAQQLASELNVGIVDCDDNPTIRSRFSVGGYPTFLYLRNGTMYQYRGPRTAEAWTEFVREGYKSVEGEEMPLEASMLRNFIKEFGRFFEQLKFAAKAKPLLFGGIFAAFVIVIALTCFCGSMEEKEDERRKQAAAAAAAGEKSQTQKKEE